MCELNIRMINYFQGQDGFIWFTGVVEDRNDPTKLGRVRVRCVGYHTDDKTKIPTEDLPWAWVLQTVHTPSMNGMGHTPGFLVEGTWVVGFFRDPEMLQEPIILGSLPVFQKILVTQTKVFMTPIVEKVIQNFLDIILLSIHALLENQIQIVLHETLKFKIQL